VKRMLFTTDVHGSVACFKKFVASAKFYEADVIVMGGDCTGKMLVPVISNGGGYKSSYLDREWVLATEDEKADFVRKVADAGYYPLSMDQDEFDELRSDPHKVEERFAAVMVSTLEGWLEYAKDKLKGNGVMCVVTPGNDDHLEIDAVLEADDFVIAGENHVIRLDDEFEMLSVGWTNPTPWDTPRECDEGPLGERIEKLVPQVQDIEKAIFNLHAPPYGSGLDQAPEMDKNGVPLRGGTVMTSVGSTAVRDALQKYQPMLGLHGHIHESRGTHKIGRTLCINPGSNYGDLALNGVVLEFKKGKLKSHMLTCG
jgi:uncharacterized protein